MFKYFIATLKGGLFFKSISIFNIVLITPLFTRYLGTENYGYYNYLLTAISIFGTISTMGIYGYLGTYIPAKPKQHERAELFYTGVAIRTLFYALSIPVFVLLMYSHFSGLKIEDKYIPLIAVNAFILPIYDLLLSLLNSFLRIKTYYALMIASAVMMSAIAFFTYFLSLSVWQLILLQTFLPIILMGLPAYIICRMLGAIKLNFSLAKIIIPSGIVITINGALWLLMTFADRFFIIRYLGRHDLSLYTLAGAMCMSVLAFSVPFSSFFGPLVAKSFRDNDDTLLVLTIKRFSILIPLTTLPLVMGFIIYGEPFIKYYAGEDFSDTFAYVFLLAIGFYIHNYSSFFMGICILKDRAFIKRVAYYNFGAVILNIPLNYILIQQYGGIGAVYATFVTFLYLSCMLMYTAIKNIPSNMPRLLDFLPIYINVAIVYGTGYWLWDSSYGLIWCFIYSALSMIALIGLSMLLKEPRLFILRGLFKLRQDRA